MDETSAWQNFASSGSVADYLVYCAEKHENAHRAEETYEDSNRRSDFNRTDYW